MKQDNQLPTMQEVFMDTDFIDYISIEMTMPPQSETEGKDVVRLGLRTILKGKRKGETIDIKSVLPITPYCYYRTPNLQNAYDCIATVYRAFGFGGPTDGAEIFADSLDGEIVTARWTIAKIDRELSVKQMADITVFKFGNADRETYKLVSTEYGSDEIHDIHITAADLNKFKQQHVH